MVEGTFLIVWSPRALDRRYQSLQRELVDTIVVAVAD